MPKHRRDGSEDRDRRSWGHGSRSMERDAKRTKSRRNRSRTPSWRDKSPSRNRRYRSPSRSSASTIRDRSQSRERVQRRRSRSRSGELAQSRPITKVSDRASQKDNHQINKSDIEKLTGGLCSQVQLSSMTGEGNQLNEKILPEFDPESKELTAARWVSEVNHCAEVHHWNDWQKLYLATLRLRGCARGWFEQISVSDFPILSWQELSMAICKKFPVSKTFNFGQTLEEVVNFTCDFSIMSLMTYNLEKINRINRLNLNLSEDKMFELVVHGITDMDLRMKAQIFCKNKTLAELDEFVNMFSEGEIKRKNEQREFEGNKRNGRNYPLKSFRKSQKGNTCFNCGEVGHQKRLCPGLRRGNSPQD